MKFDSGREHVRRMIGIFWHCPLNFIGIARI